MRTKGLPGIVSPAGFKRMILSGDESLYEASHWVYFRKSRIVAMEFNAHAPQARMFAIYLKKMAQSHNLPIDDVQLIVKVDPDTVERLRRLGPITEIQAAVYSSQAASIRQSGGIAQALRSTAQAMVQSFKAEVTFSRERPAKNRPRGFGREIKEQVIELWTESGDVLTSLKVRAEPPGGGEPVLVDFKRDRFSTRLPVALADGTVSSGDIYASIIKYFEDSQLGATGAAQV